MTYQLGTDWIARNVSYLDQLKCPYEIKRWDYFLQHPLYPMYKDTVSKLYENGLVKEEFDETIAMFQQRDNQINTTNCLQYLKEECPAILCISALSNYDTIIYPKPMTKAMSSIYEQTIKDNFPGKCKWIYLKFKKKGLQQTLAA